MREGSIYREQNESISNRIDGRIESGNVPHSRRVRPFIGSTYAVGRARSGQWTAGRPVTFGRRSTTR